MSIGSMDHRSFRWRLSPLRPVAESVWRCLRTVLVFAAALGPATPPPPPVKVKEEDGDGQGARSKPS